MGGRFLKFKKHPRYPHQRSEGLTRRGQRRIAQLLRVVLPVRCTLHNGIERGVHPYRCHVCGQCFVCAHRPIGYTHWRCSSGEIVPSTPSPGTPAE